MNLAFFKNLRRLPRVGFESMTTKILSHNLIFRAIESWGVDLHSQLSINSYSISDIACLHKSLQTIVGNKAKGWISKRLFQENKTRQIFRKTKISNPLIPARTCAYQEVRNSCFSENFPCFVLLKQPFWDSPFCLITDAIDLFAFNDIYHVYISLWLFSL